VFVLLACFLSPSPGSAQQPADSLQARLDRLTALVDSLSAEVRRLQASGQEEEAGDALARLRAAASQAAQAEPSAEEAPEQEFVGRQRSLQALNPEISMSADVFAQVNQDETGQDNFFAREFELAIQSSLDPFSRAKVFISRHVPGGEIEPFPEGEEHAHEEGAGFSVEEGYVEWVGLPAGLGVKLGKFYQSFGQLNRWHSHALPFQSRSLPHLAYIGEEPLAQTGVSARWLLPFAGAGTYEATFELTRSESELLFGESEGVSVLGHLNGFWNLSESFDVDLGLSWINGSYEDEVASFDRNLFGAETALTWRPPGQSRYRSFTFRGGVMVLDGLNGDAPGEDRSVGLWTGGELRLTERWYVGTRFDRLESPENPEDTAWLVSPTITWWQSEWVRIRAEYDLLGGSLRPDNEGRFLLQVTFAMGPHKHETY
jgi:hypothetical protein